LLYFLFRTQAFSVSQLLHLPLKSTSKREQFQTPQQNQQCNCKQRQQSIFGAKSFAIYNAGWLIEFLFCHGNRSMPKVPTFPILGTYANLCYFQSYYSNRMPSFCRLTSDWVDCC